MTREIVSATSSNAKQIALFGTKSTNMQHKKHLKFESEKDPWLRFLAIFFISGTIILFVLMVYYMSIFFRY